MTIFEYAIILHPTKREKEEDDAVSKIVVPITSMVADNLEHAKLIAGRAIPQDLLTHLNRVEVAVRPF